MTRYVAFHQLDFVVAQSASWKAGKNETLWSLHHVRWAGGHLRRNAKRRPFALYWSRQLCEWMDGDNRPTYCIFSWLYFRATTVTQCISLGFPTRGPRGTFLWPASPFRGVGVFSAFKKFAEKMNCQWYKLTNVCTGGAPAMKGWSVWFCAEFKQFAGKTLLKYPCIIYQESLCKKWLQMKNVMSVVVKCVNNIRASALKKREFRQLLNRVDEQNR